MGHEYAQAIKTEYGFRVCFFDADEQCVYTTSWCASELTAAVAAGRWWQRCFPGRPIPPFAAHRRGKRLCQREVDRITTWVHAPLDLPDDEIGEMGELEGTVAAASDPSAP